MANVTDPLAQAIHGTNPQNLIEYITRQRIYDSQYWKEECFGLTASDVVEKACEQLHTIGGVYGSNSQPTRFLSLILKLLQIQPEEGIVGELVENEDFKYVRALGAFYLRLTGRPADIYESLEPLYNDYRKLRFRTMNGWEIIHVDDFIDELLTQDRVCGIALPRLPKRDVLVEGGYLQDKYRPSAMNCILNDGKEEEDENDYGIDDDDDEDMQYHIKNVARIQRLLIQMAMDGNKAAKEALDTRNIKYTSRKNDESENDTKQSSSHDDIEKESGQVYGAGIEQKNYDDEYSKNKKRRNEDVQDGKDDGQKSKKRSKSKQRKKDDSKKYGSLFKSSSSTTPSEKSFKKHINQEDNDGDDESKSEEYWNEQREKLGLKPLRK